MLCLQSPTAQSRVGGCKPFHVPKLPQSQSFGSIPKTKIGPMETAGSPAGPTQPRSAPFSRPLSTWVEQSMLRNQLLSTSCMEDRSRSGPLSCRERRHPPGKLPTCTSLGQNLEALALIQSFTILGSFFLFLLPIASHKARLDRIVAHRDPASPFTLEP